MSEGLPTAAAPERLAAAVAALAGRVQEADVRAQLHALGSLLASAAPHAAASASAPSGHTAKDAPVAAEHATLEREIEAAMAAEDEAAAIAAMRSLAAIDRAAVTEVDWSAASNG